MRKIFSLILFIVLALYSTFYSKTTEATGVTPTMEVTLDKAYQGLNGLWNWKFNIKTTYTPDNTKVSIETFELVRKISNTEVTIKNNSATYIATDLKSGQAYSVYFTLGNYSPVIKKTYSGTPGSSSQKPQINNFSPAEGKIGDIVTITGNYFNGTKGVFFGVKSVDISKATINNSEIKIPVPDGAMSGKITVKNTAGETVSSQIFNLASDPVNVDAQQDSKTGDSTYTLLAPLPGLKTAPENVGDYFNIIFKIAIGLCAVLAVIMIVIGGIQYMGQESIFGKAESKGRIGAAILGLIIALGAYALLNTINPDLLGGNGVTIKQVSAEIDEAPILSDINTPIPSGTSNSFTYCKGGVRKTAVKTKEGYMTFCSTYSSKLQLMISDAYHSSPSIVLSGGAFRDAASQIAARKNNCADVYNTPPNQCHPPTAKPGTSAHENGLAVDFTCDGKLINWQTNKNATDYQPKYSINQDTKKCFNWLSSNASKYGFKNYSKENWHWSTGDLAGH